MGGFRPAGPQGISFFTRPGEMTALMGGSGAGKTTLMDCLLGRKTVGLLRGDILVNGYPKEQASWARVCGYVEQTGARAALRCAALRCAALRRTGHGSGSRTGCHGPAGWQAQEAAQAMHHC